MIIAKILKCSSLIWRFITFILLENILQQRFLFLLQNLS